MNVHLYLALVCLAAFAAVIIAWFILRLARQDYEQNLEHILDDLSLESMRDLEAHLAEFRNEHGLGLRARLDEVSSILKIIDCGDSDMIGNERARLTESNEDGFMRVYHNSGVPQNEKLFDYAHECGHVINGDIPPLARPENRHTDRVEERKADYMAAALLMPLNQVYEELNNNSYRETTHRERLKLVKKMSAEYGVTEINVLRRIKEVYLLTDAYPVLLQEK